MHVSSTEPHEFHQLGDVSTLPEKYGMDFLWYTKGWCGVQRKEIKDLSASLRDGRLGREIAQMESLKHKMLIVEGMIEQVGDQIIYRNQPLMGKALWWATLWGLQANNISITFTRNKTETAAAVQAYEHWTSRDTHTALSRTRNTPKVNSWGQHTNREFQIHMLTGLPGVGRGTAETIINHFGHMPINWTATEEQLCEIPGIGKTKAQRMLKALGN